MPHTQTPHLGARPLRGDALPPALRADGIPPCRSILPRLLPSYVSAFCLLALTSLLCALFPSRAAAEEGFSPWKPVIQTHKATPERLVAVDKSQQRLFLFERDGKSPQAKEFVCTTGKVEGDKVVEGDLKTPEGIYFIVQHIGAGLDYLKYGREAYTLNYPNPVDRLRQKTGYGIWIHGRGEPLVPRQTEGCVAMFNEDLAGMRAVLQPGTPVALTSSLSFEAASPPDVDAVRALEKNIQDWAAAWAARSEDMFAFYDKQAYTVAQGEPFSLFQTQKERLFKSLPWIRTTVENIHVLEGPGYWVTWFFQDYQAPNLTTKGVRRLYWVRDDKGQYKIVGMEWSPGMTTGTLLASAEPAMPPLEASPRTEEQNAAQSRGETAAASSPLASPLHAPVAAPPRAGTVLAGADSPALRRDHVESPVLGEMAAPALAPVLIALNRGNAVPLGAWTGAQPLPERTMALPAAAPASPPLRPVPPRNLAHNDESPLEGSPQKEGPQEAAPAQADNARLLASRTIFSLPATDIFYPPERRAPDVLEAATETQAEGAPALDAASDIVPLVHIVEESDAEPAAGKSPAEAALSANATRKSRPEAVHLEAAAGAREVASLVKAWHNAWSSANLEAYMTFYAPHAVQGSRRKAIAIRRQKEELWSKVKPARLLFSDMHIVLKNKQVLVDMHQHYSDTGGNADTGIKSLLFENINGAWLITREEWSPMPDEAGN